MGAKSLYSGHPQLGHGCSLPARPILQRLHAISAAAAPMQLDDSLTPELPDLRDDGVSEASQSVNPIGNPMSHSTHSGFRAVGGVDSPLGATDRLTEVAKPSPDFAERPARLLLPLTVGVGRIWPAIDSGVPMPLPFFAVALTRSRLASQVSSPSPSFGLLAAGVGHIATRSSRRETSLMLLGSLRGPHIPWAARGVGHTVGVLSC